MSQDSAETLAAANDRLRVLSSRVITIQEEERRHISRELHDDVGQSLTALKMGLHRLVPLAGADAQALLAECVSMAGATLERVRRLAHDMRPPQLDLLGLEEAMRWLVEGQRAATGIEIKSHFNGLLHRRFSSEVETACYRITQEALSNATRHANPKSILVTLEAGRTRLRLTVRDDGRGFDPSSAARRSLGSGSLGLISMDERAALAGGVLELRSDEGDGAMVRVTFTLSPEQQ